MTTIDTIDYDKVEGDVPFEPPAQKEKPAETSSDDSKYFSLLEKFNGKERKAAKKSRFGDTLSLPTPRGIILYPSLIRPKLNFDASQKKSDGKSINEDDLSNYQHEVTMFWKRGQTIKDYQNTIIEWLRRKYPQVLSGDGFNFPFKSGDEYLAKRAKDGGKGVPENIQEVYHNSIYLVIKRKAETVNPLRVILENDSTIEVVQKNYQVVKDQFSEDLVYSGMIGSASLSWFQYKMPKFRGVSCFFDGLKIYPGGERLYDDSMKFN